MNKLLDKDLIRYGKMRDIPLFQRYMRKAQNTQNRYLRLLYKGLFKFFRLRNHVEISVDCNIGEGFYIGHPYCITINPKTVIGKNCNIHKGVTIGQENRGVRKGAPTIGNDVWIGVNSTIVGNISIGSDVLIAPNTYVNCDIPSHSIVIGNPCVVKEAKETMATVGYINNRVLDDLERV